ncbi:MAG: PD40 domain-containing protein [Acidobacteriaceae bacterium]|nr:PD40 domain-containing protein [Acidobacteriaceae bacterium]
MAGEYAGERLLSTTAPDEEPRYSADGSRVAFLLERPGALRAWVSGADGTNPVPMSRFDRAEKAWLTWGPAAVLSVFAQPQQGAALFQAGGGGAARGTTRGGGQGRRGGVPQLLAGEQSAARALAAFRRGAPGGSGRGEGGFCAGD